MRIAQWPKKDFSGHRILWLVPNVLGIEARCLCGRQRGEAHATDRDKVQDKA
jgi:hypothetical protein